MKLAQVHTILFEEVLEQKYILGKLIWQCMWNGWRGRKNTGQEN